jgi:hypothetical protein
MQEYAKRKAQRRFENLMGVLIIAATLLFAISYNALLAYRDMQ